MKITRANKFNVIFKPNRPQLNDTMSNTIYVYPEDNKWNDFKYKTHCSYLIKRESSYSISGNILVSIVDKDMERSEYTGLGNIFDDNPRVIEREHVDKLFFTLLPSISDYRELVKSVGPEKTAEILSSLNDLVFFSKYKKNTSWLKKSLQSDVFKKSFMRNSEPFFAFHNAADIIRGLEFEELEYISKKLELSFKLDGFKNEHKLTLNFGSSDIVPKRINILIGENGLGKSQSLNQFVRSSLQQRGYIRNLIDPLSPTGRPMINRILAIGTPGETANTYPSDSIKNPKLNYKRLLLTRNGRANSDNMLGNSIVKLARLDESIGMLDRWDIFIKAIEHALPLDKIFFQISDENQELDFISLKMIKFGYNEERQLKIWSSIDNSADPKIKGDDGFYPMSSGQLSFFKFALLACLHIENGSFVLLDEPETHLHPSLISDFVTLLDNILEKTGSYALIATHSPYFVREVTREQVHIFKHNRDGFIYIKNPRLKTFGANIGDISYFVFDEDIGNSLSHKTILKLKHKKISYTVLKEKLGSELPTEMLQEIKILLQGK